MTTKKLTAKQTRLLAYPPKPGTWECPDCHMYNPEKRALCWCCDRKLPRRIRRPTLHEQYLEACRLAGREPISSKEAAR